MPSAPLVSAEHNLKIKDVPNSLRRHVSISPSSCSYIRLRHLHIHLRHHLHLPVRLPRPL